MLEDSWPDKIVSNVSIHALAIRHRFTAVSPHETAIRLYQSLSSGSGLDFCIVGPCDGIPIHAMARSSVRFFTGTVIIKRYTDT